MSALGQRVLDFAISQGSGVFENGECWTLAERALEHAGAMTSNDLQNVAATTDYVWGTLVNKTAAEPGDIIQYLRGFHFTRKVIGQDGGWATDAPLIAGVHHTAIVERVVERGRYMRVIDQNMPAGAGVNTRDCYFSAYSFTDTVGNTVQIGIVGQARFYRPRPRSSSGSRRPRR